MHNLKVVQWNCRGIRNKLPLMNGSLLRSSDIIVLQETFLKSGSMCDFPHKVTYRSDRVGRPGGGLLIAVNNTLSSACLPCFSSPAGNEIMGVKVFMDGCSFNIVNVYSRSGLVLADLRKYCSSLSGPLLILGDFNLHHPLWGASSASRVSEEFVEWLTSSSICIINSSQWTHLAPNGTRSLLDLSLCSPDLLARTSCLVDEELYDSDHYPIHLTIDSPVSFQPPRRSYCWTKVCSEVNNAFSNLHSLDYETFSRVTQMAMSNNIRSPRPSNSGYPAWWTLRCSALLKQKKFCLKTAIRQCSEEFWIKYKKISALLRKTILDAKRDFWDRTCRSAGDPKILFRVFRKFRSRAASSPDSHFTFFTDGGPVTDALAQSHIFAQLFSGDRTFEPLALTYGSDIDGNLNRPFTMLELSDAIQSTKVSTPGEDGVSALLFKGLNDHSRGLLLQLYNSIWLTACIPSSWSSAVIIPIPKPGKPRRDPSSYRPIALTSVACKICERIIMKRLSSFILNNKLLDHRHLGFLPYRDSHTAVTMLNHDIAQAKKEKKFIVGISLDIQAAYDSVYIDGLILKCASLGITGPILHWLHKFLASRWIKVSWRNTTSSAFPSFWGVPQGAVLSPILFTIFMADLFEALGFRVKCLVYADDIFIYFIGDSLSQCRLKLQEALRSISRWCEYWKLNIRPDKCSAINLSRRSGDCDFDFSVNGGLIEWADNAVKFLGFIFARRGGLKPHCEYLRKKAFVRINVLKALASKRFGARSHHLVTLMTSSIRSLFDYGASILSTACDSQLQKIEVMQNSGLRVALGLPKWTPIILLRKHAGLPPLAVRLRDLATRFWVKHLSLDQWSPLVIHLQDQLVESMSTSLPTHVLNLFEETACCPAQLLRFYPPETFPEGTVRFYLESLPFQDTALSEVIISSLYAEFISRFISSHEVFASDASKSTSITAIAGCSSEARFAYRTHTFHSVFTAEALAVGTTLDELAWASRAFIILTDSLSVLKALQSVSSGSPRVILWLQRKIFSVCSRATSIIFVWVPGHRGIPLNEEADRLAKSVVQQDVLLDWASPEDLLHYSKSQSNLKTLQQFDHSKYYVSHGAVPQIAVTSAWGRGRREDVLISRLVCRMLITPALLFRFQIIDSGLCHQCRVLDSLDHILFSCRRYQHQRKVCFDSRFLTSASLNSFPSFIQTLCSSTAFRCSVLTFLYRIARF